ncbi:hypothetical protein BYT27DRAFT_7192458 [Phlegmacium glaucopus]|nr:hypothetical protein BYT27DRAFT_7192458 [Phlegmacium glaucopus]
MFTRLRNTIIQGGIFVQTSAPPTSEGFKILHANIATGAFHDSGERFDAPKCHPNTRKAVLAEIMQWIQDVEESEHVLWLYGSAGAGKSAIAQTIAEMCAKWGLLVASFFFSRLSPSRNNEKHLIASIAYQLALSIPATRIYVEAAVQSDPAVFDKSLDTQIEMLIIQPLKNACAVVDPAITKKWPRLIVVDGLDECHGPLIQSSIIRVLSTALLHIPLPLILLVASRPEPHIRNAFNLLNKSQASRHIVLDDSYEPDADIKVFLLSRFEEIKENHPLAVYIPKSWPSAEIIDRLVRKSSGQFIYASTVMKYLDSPNHRPMKRLDAIIGLRPIDGEMPYKELDALYSHILSCVDDLASILKIFGFLFFRDWSYATPVTPYLVADLLGLDEEDVHLCLSELHSILYVPPPKTSGMSITVIHASLQDFLVDTLRSGRHYIDEEAFHTDLAHKCLRQVSTLSINTIERRSQRSEGSFGAQEYLTGAFIYHCSRASTDSANLKNDLIQVSDLRPWCGIRPASFYHRLPSLFDWLYKADTPAKKLSSHFKFLFDQHLTTKLNEYKFNGSNVDIAGLIFFPFLWNSPWFSLISGISQVPDIFPFYAVYSPVHMGDEERYRRLLIEFFEDKNRSGKYHVDGIVYAHAALECFRNMVNPNDDEIFNPYPFITGIERPDAKLFMSLTGDVASRREILVPNYKNGLDAVSKLLLKAAPLTDLYICVRDHPLQNPAKAKVHCEHGFTSLRLAVKAYLDVICLSCGDINLTLNNLYITRSSSCPLYFPCMDLESKFGNHLGTFNERWPLVTDSLTRPSAWRRFHAKMHQILELRLSRHFNKSKHPHTKIVHSQGERGIDSGEGH